MFDQEIANNKLHEPRNLYSTTKKKYILRKFNPIKVLGKFQQQKKLMKKLRGKLILFIKTGVQLYVLVSLFGISLCLTGCAANEILVEEKPSETAIEPSEISNSETTVTAIPVITPTDKVTVLYEGEVVLQTELNEAIPLSCLDLDSGNQGLGNSDKGDIALRGSKGSGIFYYLLPINNALGYSTSIEEVDFRECSQMLSTFSSGAIPDLGLEGSVCVLTNEGHIASIKSLPNSIFIDQNGKMSITISFIVWDQVLE